MNAEHGKSILVVANETVVGPALIDAVKRRAGEGPIFVHVICPQNQPKHGFVIYDDTVRGAADNRLQTTLAQLREAGIEATGELMDPDPYTAVMDALGERDYDEIVISTHPETRSGWLRQGLVQRVEQAARRPVEHVVVEVGDEDDELTRTLVVANQTVAGEELFKVLKEKAEEKPRRFTVISPQSDSSSPMEAHERLARLLKRLQDEGLQAVGQVVHPDPYTAIHNALQFYGADEIVISTFPETRSGWLRGNLIGRVRASVSQPVEHVVSAGEQVEAE